MKKLLLGAAAVIAVAAPSVASADTNAIIGVDYNSIDFDVDTFDSWGINGAFSHDFSNGWLLQAEGDTSRIDVGIGDFSDSYGAIHVGTRNDTYALGGYVTFEEFFSLAGLGVGVEGQYYLNNFVIGGSLGYVEFDEISDLSVTSLQLDGAYFFTPNFSVNALFATSDFEDIDSTTFGIGAEYRVHGPVSISAGWRNDDYDVFDADTISIGLTVDLGTGTLHERQLQGPSLQGARNMNDLLDTLIP